MSVELKVWSENYRKLNLENNARERGEGGEREGKMSRGVIYGSVPFYIVSSYSTEPRRGHFGIIYVKTFAWKTKEYLLVKTAKGVCACIVYLTACLSRA